MTDKQGRIIGENNGPNLWGAIRDMADVMLFLAVKADLPQSEIQKINNILLLPLSASDNAPVSYASGGIAGNAPVAGMEYMK